VNDRFRRNMKDKCRAVEASLTAPLCRQRCWAHSRHLLPDPHYGPLQKRITEAGAAEPSDLRERIACLRSGSRSHEVAVRGIVPESSDGGGTPAGAGMVRCAAEEDAALPSVTTRRSRRWVESVVDRAGSSEPALDRARVSQRGSPRPASSPYRPSFNWLCGCGPMTSGVRKVTLALRKHPLTGQSQKPSRCAAQGLSCASLLLEFPELVTEVS
jgi:hypothetical protein